MDDRCRMRHWIDQSRCLLIDILRRDHLRIIHMWFNIYNGVYDQLTTSMTASKCLELLCAPPTNYQDTDICTTLNNVISSFHISIPHPTSLKSPIDAELRADGLAEKVFNFDREYAATKVIDKIPTIFLNHQVFDVNRQKQDDLDVISESNGILFLAVVLAHEITHAVNLFRSIYNASVREKHTPKLVVFCSYFNSKDIDAGNLTERLLLDGELHLSKPPPTPLILFLIISADGTQIPLSKEVVEECIQKRSFSPISQSINSFKYINIRQLTTTHSREGSSVILSALQPLLSYQSLTVNVDPSSPTIPKLTPMMHTK